MMGLYAKLANVMASISGIKKEGKNQFFNYKFTTADDAYAAVREALADQGLAFIASMVDVQQHETGQTDKGGNPVVRTVAKFEYVFVDPETGEQKVCLWHGEATDSQDKGVSKASTSALKYFLLKTFIISTEADDPDKSDGYQPKQQKKPPSPQQIRNAGNALEGKQPEPPQATTPPAAKSNVVPMSTQPSQGDVPASSKRSTFAEFGAYLNGLVATLKKGTENGTIAEGQQKNLAIAMQGVMENDTRKFLLQQVFGVDSSKQLNERRFFALKEWLNSDPQTVEADVKLVIAAKQAALARTAAPITADAEFAAI